MIKSVLVATDASPPSNRALAMAIDLAATHGAKLDIIYVVRDMQLPAKLRKMAEVESLAESRGDVLMFVAGQVLDEAAGKAKKRGVEAVHTHVGSGDPAGAIIAHARRRKSDLVILGTRGLSKAEGMLLGSVSRKVVNLCQVNCMIVR